LTTAATDPYAHIRKPLEIGNCTVRNRIVRTAHGTNLLGLDGSIPEAWIAFHERRAEGGIGLSIGEVAPIHPSAGRATPGYMKLWDESIVAQLEPFTARMHAQGMSVFQQLWHGGVSSAGAEGQPAWSASTVADPSSGRVPIAMTKTMIDDVVAGFAECAARCERAGYDGVEVHGAHSYLVHQFLTPVYNRREDDYGGPLENRMRFLVEILEACRAAVGTGFPVGVRLSAIDLVPNGMEPDDVAEVAARLERAGLVDFVDISLSTYHDQPKMLAAMYDPHGYELPTSRPVSAAVAVPTIVAGRITSLAEAEAIVADGTADMVSMVRAAIADPDFVNKSFALEPERVRPCIGCNQGCMGFIFSGLGVCCTVNPQAGRESVYPDISPAAEPLRVVVVGGGPAGMEAARTAALAGHTVSLHEASPTLGGQTRIASRAKLRTDLGVITAWLERELPRVGVEVHLGSRLEAASPELREADLVIVATGSRREVDGVQRMRPEEIPTGIDLPHVLSSVELLADFIGSPRRALVFDDRWDAEAASVAETLLDREVAVTFATSAPTLAPLTETSLQRAPFLRRLSSDERFELRIRQAVTRIEPEKVELTGLDDKVAREVPADLVVMISRPLADRGLYDELVEAGVHAKLIGDALEATDLVHAIHTARATLLGVDPNLIMA
jgi:2,4-dienoyl-CoA reductase-like NADH-dependent reductase (Old Yellow Enzyme family)